MHIFSVPIAIDMPPKGGNAKKESGRAKKAENEAKKQQAAEADRVRPHTHYVVSPKHGQVIRSARKRISGQKGPKGTRRVKTRKPSDRQS